MLKKIEHRPFSSKLVYPASSPGSEEHRKNMEAMTNEIRRSLLSGSFGSKPFFAFRGVKTSDFVISGEHVLCTYLELNAEDNYMYAQRYYKPSSGEILNSMGPNLIVTRALRD